MKRRIAVRQRLGRICTSYLLFLMVVTTKHSLEEAARFSRLHKSLFSLHSALCTKGAVCSGLRNALLVYPSRCPVRAAGAMEVGLTGLARSHEV
jgi:hypothetical protein